MTTIGDQLLAQRKRIKELEDQLRHTHSYLRDVSQLLAIKCDSIEKTLCTSTSFHANENSPSPIPRTEATQTTDS